MLLHHWPISIPLPNAFIHWNPDLLLLCRLGTTLSYAWQHSDLLRTRGPRRVGHFWRHWKWNGKTITNHFPICNLPLQVSFRSLPRRRLPQFNSASGHSQILFDDDDVHKISIFHFPWFKLIYSPKSILVTPAPCCVSKVDVVCAGMVPKRPCIHQSALASSTAQRVHHFSSLFEKVGARPLKRVGLTGSASRKLWWENFPDELVAEVHECDHVQGMEIILIHGLVKFVHAYHLCLNQT